MSRLLMLDTDTASYIMRGVPELPRRRLVEAANAEICVSAITEGELRFGIAKRGASRKMLTALEDLLRRIRVISWDSAAASAYAELRSRQKAEGRPLSTLDMVIAAHAVAVDATLVTADRAFHSVRNLEIRDWTQP